jgi:hypothetical protein
MMIAQHLVAHSLHHRPVPLDQRSEGRFITTSCEPVKQFSIGEAGNRASLEKHAKMAVRNRMMSIGHGSGSLFHLDFRI